MGKKKEIFCTGCNQLKISDLKLCRSCYNKNYFLKRDPELCSFCGKYGQIDIKNPKTCHACYEIFRRNKQKEQAKLNPELKKILGEKSKQHYKKSKDKGYYNTEKRRIQILLKGYRSRNCVCELDETWIKENVIGGKCHYCNSTDEESHIMSGKKLGVDKKDPTKGYTKDNSVVCCFACNTFKLNIWTYEEFLELAKTIKKLIKKRSKSIFMEKK